MEASTSQDKGIQSKAFGFPALLSVCEHSAWLRPSMAFTSTSCSDGIEVEKEEREGRARRTKGASFSGALVLSGSFPSAQVS